MKIWKKLKGPKGRKASLFAGEVVSYSGFAALLIYPGWYNIFSLIGICVVLVLVLSPFFSYAADVSKKGESGFTFALLLTNVLVLPPLATFTVKTSANSDNALLACLVVTFVITSLISRWSRKKLPGV